MTTKYKNFNRKSNPNSLFRYTHQIGYDKNLCDIDRMKKLSLITETYRINGKTIDFKFYKGDEKVFKTYFEKVLSIFIMNEEDFRSYDHSSNGYEDYEFHRYVSEYTDFLDSTKHYTVLFHSCEVWGNEPTKKYFEIFPSNKFKMNRLDRNTLFGWIENGKFEYRWSGMMDDDDVEPKTKTPKEVLIKNVYRQRSIDKLNEMISDLSSYELNQLNDFVSKILKVEEVV